MRIHLTYDDGPNPLYTADLLDVLDRFGATATFFMVGAYAERHPDLVRRVAVQGSTIGNHTMTHTIRPATPGAETSYLDEVGQTSDVLEAITGRRPTAFRPPWGRDAWAAGSTRAPMAQETASLGLRLWLWDAKALDWENPQAPADILVRRIEKEMSLCGAPQSGSDGWVVLFHDGVPDHELPRTQDNTIPATAQLLEKYSALGYVFEALPGS
jgi:peptidoglycan/xylan/chitin deacetylase (PgdA/CDA1 family)